MPDKTVRLNTKITSECEVGPYIHGTGAISALYFLTLLSAFRYIPNPSINVEKVFQKALFLPGHFLIKKVDQRIFFFETK